MSNSFTLESIINELAQFVKLVRQADLDTACDQIADAKRVFVAGAGRSGFVARAFSNRLMHLGLTVFYVGEPTTPSIRRYDLLIICSGSGETPGLVTMASKAKASGASLLAITIAPGSSVGKLSDHILKLPGHSNKIESGIKSIQPMGNAFEQLAWLTCDALVIQLQARLGESEDEMFARHANLE